MHDVEHTQSTGHVVVQRRDFVGNSSFSDIVLILSQEYARYSQKVLQMNESQA